MGTESRKQKTKYKHWLQLKQPFNGLSASNIQVLFLFLLLILILEEAYIYGKIANIVQSFHIPNTQFPPLLTLFISNIHLSQLMSQY